MSQKQQEMRNPNKGTRERTRKVFLLPCFPMLLPCFSAFLLGCFPAFLLVSLAGPYSVCIIASGFSVYASPGFDFFGTDFLPEQHINAPTTTCAGKENPQQRAKNTPGEMGDEKKGFPASFLLPCFPAHCA
jgi:hypothetical protein